MSVQWTLTRRQIVFASLPVIVLVLVGAPFQSSEFVIAEGPDPPVVVYAQIPAPSTPAPGPKPFVRVLREPRSRFILSMLQVDIQLSVSILNADEQYWCPGKIEILWGDGETSSGGRDCVPYEQASAEDRSLQEYGPFQHTYKVKGAVTITVSVYRGRKLIDRKQGSFELR